MKIYTKTINGKTWHIAEYSKRNCKYIGLEYPTFSVWEHDSDYDYYSQNGNIFSLQEQGAIMSPIWWWINSENDADSYDEAIKWCNQFGK